MPRNKTTFIDLMVELPWWVSVLVSATVYVMMAHVLPTIQTDNQITAMVFKAFVIPAPYLAGVILLAAPFAFLNARRKAKQLDTQRNIQTVRDLHWRNFEELVAEAYRRQGYRVTEGGYGADGGIDLELRRDGLLILVQCKQWKTQKVGVNVVREMFGVLTAHQANYFIIISSGTFTQQAIDFAAGKPIELLDGPKLLALVNDVQVSPQVTIEKPKVCPKCSGELVERTAKRGPNAGNRFLGCSNFPKCRYTE
jgi:restriction system protein